MLFLGGGKKNKMKAGFWNTELLKSFGEKFFCLPYLLSFPPLGVDL